MASSDTVDVTPNVNKVTTAHHRATIPQTIASIHTLTSKPAIIDCGATDTLVRHSDEDHMTHGAMTAGTMLAALPNGTTITSTATRTLNAPAVIPSTIPAHLMSNSAIDRTLVAAADYTNRGCVVTLTSTAVTVDLDGATILRGEKKETDKLWPVPTAVADWPAASLSNVISQESNAEFVTYSHATFGSPPLSTLLRGLRRGYLNNYPRLTAEMILKNKPVMDACARGYLDRVRQGQHSTKSGPNRSRTSQLGDAAQPRGA